MDQLMQRIADIWNQGSFPKIVAALIGFGVLLLLLTFLPVILGLIAIIIVGLCLYKVWNK
jgi:hypothetical protein